MEEQHSTEAFMRRYGKLMDEGVCSGKADGQTLAAMFADHFVASSPAGIMGGEGGPQFGKLIVDGIANYRRLGGTRFIVASLAVSPIDELHNLARVGWRFDYRRPSDGREGTIGFENVYFVSRVSGQAKIFGWVTPDEQAALKAHGLA